MVSKLFEHSVLPFSESAWLISFEPVIDRGLNHMVHRLAAEALQRWPGRVEPVPAYASLLLRYDCLFTRSEYAEMTASITDWLRNAAKRPTEEKSVGLVKMPVCYHPDLGNDLEAVASHLGLTPEAIIHAHCSTAYQVFMVGFRPGFPYLGVLPKVLEMPRKARPVFTRAGSVAIAGQQTGIYPTPGPGGWHVLGHTPIRLFDVVENPPAKLLPGIEVEFYPISLEAYREACS